MRSHQGPQPYMNRRTCILLKHCLQLSLMLCLCFAVSFACVQAVATGQQSVPAQGVENVPPTVKVNRFVAAIRVGRERLYRLSFDYNFPGRTRVIVVGFGEVPAKGSLSYLTPAKTLVFQDERGQVLLKLNLKITGTPEGAASKMPAPEDFPPEHKSYLRSGNLSAEYCNSVLNEFFESGYRPRVEQSITYYVTAYQNVPGAPQGKIARMALQISTPFPAQSTPGMSSFQIQMIVQEQGILSPGPAQNVSTTTMNAANTLRDAIAERLAR
jgi:hypothetical protein